MKRARLVADYDAILTATGQLAEMPVGIGVMDFAFMGGSMGSVVGEDLAPGAAVAGKEAPPDHRLGVGRRADAGRGALAHADGQGRRGPLAAGRAADPYVSILTNPPPAASAPATRCWATRSGRTRRRDWLCRTSRHQAGVGPGTCRRFQTAEFLSTTGMLDAVVHRKDLKQTVGRLLRHT